MLTYAKEAGLYVIARASPHCNAETSGGGYALWAPDGNLGMLRTSDEIYRRAWLPWITKIYQILTANQVISGGVRSKLIPKIAQAYKSSARILN